MLGVGLIPKELIRRSFLLGIYETGDNDARCEIQFDFTEKIDDDLLFNATRLVNVDEMIDPSVVSYMDDLSSVILDDDLSSTNGGSLGFISLFVLFLLNLFRISFLFTKTR